ncbi:UNVERIFIED_CONTAM: hypothetical protein K2H54_015543 [Gekko kuhli]
MKASPEEGEEAAREADGRCGRSEAEAERLRTRERLEATLAGLAELEFLRQRQELRVRRLLLGASPAAASSSSPPPGDGAAGPAPRSLEEKFLEENILLLRRQLVSGSVAGSASERVQRAFPACGRIVALPSGEASVWHEGACVRGSRRKKPIPDWGRKLSLFLDSPLLSVNIEPEKPPQLDLVLRLLKARCQGSGAVLLRSQSRFACAKVSEQRVVGGMRLP